MDNAKLLRAVSVLRDFDDEAIERLAGDSRTEDYSSGQVVLSFGRPVDAVWVVMNGRIEVDLTPINKDDENLVLGPGEVFGEISLLTGEPAVADVTAAVASRLVRVPHDSLTREMGKNPKAARPLARLLAERLVAREQAPAEQRRVEQARAGGDGELSGMMEAPILVLNCGSSSIKYALFRDRKRVLSGLVERIGGPRAGIKHDGPAGRYEAEIEGRDHEQGLAKVFELLVDPGHGALERLGDLAAVGHRTVHGGTKFTEATLIDEAVKDEMERVSILAPLHNPINLLGIRSCEKLLPEGLPQVAVFDTAFHMTMPEHAYRYALPTSFADERMLRRFGFHGTSHKYVSQAACRFLDRPIDSLKIITCHLGNGASMAAVNHGRSVDTSMGLTPLEGLVMGTRSGDVDPGLILHLLRSKMDQEELDSLLNKKSGLLGLSGISSDCREVEGAAEKGDPRALLAITVFCYRVRKYIGAYAAAMGGMDVLVFTGGIGENGDMIRSRVCNDLGFLGIEVDEAKNRGRVKGVVAKSISKEGSKVSVLVVPTDEEGMIALESSRALSRAGVSRVLEARRDMPIPVGVSAHHVHLCQEHVEALFGPGHTLTPAKALYQASEFACVEKVDLHGPGGRVERVRVLGPARPRTQVEISRTEEYKLGIDAPIRASGDLRGTPGLRLEGLVGSVDIEEGVICAQRHIHMSPEDALAFGVKDRDVVRVEIGGERSLIYGDVLVRVKPAYRLEMHLDTDEANAGEIDTGMAARIDSIQRRAG